MSETQARLFWELYSVHREALWGELSDDGSNFSPRRWEDISERNRAALILTFDVLESQP